MKEKCVIVTGAGRGIGRAVCERFAALGARVAALSRSEGPLRETESLVTAAGAKCVAEVCDVSDQKQVSAAIDRVVGAFGSIDMVVNNVGSATLTPIEDLSPDLFDDLLRANVRSAYLVTRAAWSGLKKSAGVVVNLSSLASEDPFPGFAAYGAAKAWINLWTKALAEEGRPHGVRVFAVAPGAVETDMLRGAFPDFPPEKTLAPADVAATIAMLADEQARYASGSTIFVRR